MSQVIRLYYFTSAKYALENIQQRRIKLSFSDQVNDLFELRPFDFGEGENGRELRQIWGKAIQRHAKDQDFVSLARNWEVPTMWAHYSENHKGVCLGFDVPRAKATKIDYVEHLHPVDRRVLINQVYNSETTEIAKRTKSKHWQYENEWRVWCSLDNEERQRKLQNANELFFISFSEHLKLKEVIFGNRCTLTAKGINKELKEAESIEFITARPSFREFKMVPQRLARLQK